MRIVCVGGGPAGLYFAIQMMRRDPSHRITVIERNRPGDTFGWGVVFSDAMMQAMRVADPESAEEIAEAFNHWDNIELVFKGTRQRRRDDLRYLFGERLLQNSERGLTYRFFCRFSMATNRRRQVSAMVDSANINPRKARNDQRCRYGKVYPRIGRGFKGNCFLFSRKPLVS